MKLQRALARDTGHRAMGPLQRRILVVLGSCARATAEDIAWAIYGSTSLRLREGIRKSLHTLRDRGVVFLGEITDDAIAPNDDFRRVRMFAWLDPSDDVSCVLPRTRTRSARGVGVAGQPFCAGPAQDEPCPDDAATPRAVFDAYRTMSRDGRPWRCQPCAGAFRSATTKAAA